MSSPSTRARAAFVALVVLGAVALPSLARADGGGPVDVNMRCVGEPPRQTFDPLSPPCIPYWDHETDNGGATYQGVTRHEIRLAVVIDGGIDYLGASDPTNRHAPQSKIYDLAQGEAACRHQNSGDAGCTHLTVRGLRTWQAYFNMRFQSYGRVLHLYAVFTAAGSPSLARRQAEAEWIVDQVDPFAVVPLGTEGGQGALIAALNQQGVLTFADNALYSDDQLDSSPGQAWSFSASAERAAANFSGFACTKVVGKPAVLAGGELAGRPRVLGLVATVDEHERGWSAAAQGIRDGVAGCGGSIVDEALFDRCCVAPGIDPRPDAALMDMARFKLREITTVLAVGAVPANHFRAAQALGYQPEWVLLADGTPDGPNARALAGDVMPSNTIVISPQVVEGTAPLCEQAYREVNFSTPDSDLAYTCGYYRSLFLLAVAVQVAGPNLTPAQVDKGLHAIPPRATGAPATAACWFVPGEYSCVKDAHLARWDPLGQVTPTSPVGCFRVVEEGRRYGADSWPAGNVDAQWTTSDPCARSRP